MASEMLKPSSTHVLDIMIGQKHKNIKMEEISVTEKEDGKMIGELKTGKYKDALIIAVKSKDNLTFKPVDDFIVKMNDELILLKTPV